MKTYHMSNADYYLVVGRKPSEAERGMTFTLPRAVNTFEWGGCGGNQNVVMPAGKYTIVSRKHFSGGTMEVAATI